ncbi:hypothetical protein AS200_00455 [Streptomyces sp. CdTB01]|nr:hypothetical protein AS200_00455 [Streptomyces sp. CdTB01]
MNFVTIHVFPHFSSVAVLTYLMSRVVGRGTAFFEALSISVQFVVSTQSVTVAVRILPGATLVTFGWITGLPVVTCPAFRIVMRSVSMSNRARKVVVFFTLVPATDALL